MMEYNGHYHDINDAMVDCVKKAKESGHLYYILSNGMGGFRLTRTRYHNWLFKAYPGGRKELSLTGKNYVR